MRILLVLVLLSIVLYGPSIAFAHKALIIGDYKIDVGWRQEPPVQYEPNAIEITFSLASDFDKQRYDAVSYESTAPPDPSYLTNLEDSLDVSVKIGTSKKILLEVTEDPDFPGRYFADITPPDAGSVKVHVYGIIHDADFEVTLRPEKVKPQDTELKIPDWIRNNAKWWSEGSIGDSDFVTGIQYMIKTGILKIPVTKAATEPTEGIPPWVKNNAGWWADGLITDSDFVKGIQYLISHGIIVV